MWRLPVKSDRVQVHQCGGVVDNPSDGLRLRRHRHLANVPNLILEWSAHTTQQTYSCFRQTISNMSTWRGSPQSGWSPVLLVSLTAAATCITASYPSLRLFTSRQNRRPPQ